MVERKASCRTSAKPLGISADARSKRPARRNADEAGVESEALSGAFDVVHQLCGCAALVQSNAECLQVKRQKELLVLRVSDQKLVFLDLNGAHPAPITPTKRTDDMTNLNLAVGVQ